MKKVLKNNSPKEHWNKTYLSVELNKQGWYEEIPEPSLKLIAKCGIDKDEPILDVGAGESTLIDHLIEQGYKNITALDISSIALDKLKVRLGKEKAHSVTWIINDITQPLQNQNLKNIVVWHDRALLHFLTKEDQQNMYLTTLKKVLRRGGYVIIAAFSPKGAKKCSGLNIRNFDRNMLSEFLGEHFTLLDYFDYTYHMPSGEMRPYIYTLFQSKERE